MVKKVKIQRGSDGKPMTSWQIWLRRLCLVMVAYSLLLLILGIVFAVMSFLALEDHFGILEIGNSEVDAQFFARMLGISSFLGAAINLIVASLGIWGASDPKKITLFFWIAFSAALVTAWSLASTLSEGIIDPTNIASEVFIIALAACAWQVRKQTGYFDAKTSDPKSTPRQSDAFEREETGGQKERRPNQAEVLTSEELD